MAAWVRWGIRAGLLAVLLCFLPEPVTGQKPKESPFPEAQSVLHKEFQAVLNELGSSPTFPDTVFGSPVQGDFVWSGLAVTLADYFPQAPPGEKDRIKELILKGIRSELQGETFAQLNIVKALASFGTPLKTNALWQSMTPLEQLAVRACADADRMYDSLKREVRKGRPTNYLGVALLIAAQGWKLGLTENKGLAQHLLHQCMKHLTENEGWLNDGKPGDFRFDRYHFEFIRFVWEGAHLLKDRKALTQLEPWCQKSDALWLALQNPMSGAPFPYGRSLQNTWEDVWEYTAWMHQRGISNPETRDRVHTMFRKSWRFYIRHEFDTLRHCARMLDPGRACYSYVGPGRVWGYSIHALGKMQASLNALQDLGISVLGPDTSEKPGIRYFPLKSRFGIWIGRSATHRWVIPMVQGISKPRNNDYQAIPFCEGRSEAPVNRIAEHLCPVWLHNGKRYYPEWQWSKHAQREKPPVEMSVEAWVSKTDTILALSALPGGSPVPGLSATWNFDPKTDRMRLRYALYTHGDAPSSRDTLEFGLWTPSTESPYPAFAKPVEVQGLGKPAIQVDPSPSEPDGKGPFTPFVQKRIWRWVLEGGNGKEGAPSLKTWTVDLGN